MRCIKNTKIKTKHRQTPLSQTIAVRFTFFLQMWEYVHMPTSHCCLFFWTNSFSPYLKMSCYLILTAMGAELHTRTGEQYYMQWKIETTLMLLLIPAFLSSLQLLWWSGRIILAREIPPASPQGVIQEAGHNNAIQARLGCQHVLPKGVKVQLFKGTFSTRGRSFSLSFSSHSGKAQWWPSVVSASPIASPFSPHPILLTEPLFFPSGNFPSSIYGLHSLLYNPHFPQ